jgi:hypothetical protein
LIGLASGGERLGKSVEMISFWITSHDEAKVYRNLPYTVGLVMIVKAFSWIAMLRFLRNEGIAELYRG